MDGIVPGLSVGSQGDDVALLQAALRRLGLTVDDAVGVFGPATQRAVIQYQERQGLPATGEVDERTATRIEQATERIVAGTRAVIHGRVLAADGSPMPAVTVKAFYKTVRREVLLGEATTTRTGAYLIRSAAEDLRDAAAAVDLIVRAYAAGDAENVLIESPVVPDAPVDVELDLRATSSASRGLSEYEQLCDAIGPLLDGTEPSELSAEQVEYLAAKTGADAMSLAYLARSARLAKATGIAAEAVYGLLRRKLPVDLAALLSRHPQQWASALREAAAQNIVPASISEPATTGEILGIKARTAASHLLTTSAAPGGATLQQLLATVIDEPERQTAFARAYAGYSGTIDGFWATLRTDPEWRGTLDDVQVMLQFSALTGGHLPLVTELQRMRREQQLASVEDLARLAEPDWVRLVSRVGVPAGITGDTDAEKARAYTKALSQAVEDAFPTRFIAARIADSDLEDKQDLVTFFADNPGFDVHGARLETYLADHENALRSVPGERRAQVKTAVARIQRLYRIAPRYSHVRSLVDGGVHSAHAIARMGPSLFRAKFSGAIGSTAEAAQICERAEQTAWTAASLLGKYGVAGKVPVAVVPVSTGSDASIPDWRTLFGALELCDCEHCRSVYGPAAYLVDALHFLSERRLIDKVTYETEWLPDGATLQVVTGATVKKKTLPDGSAADATPNDVLYARRPDIWDIELSCENTNIPVPYVDLTCEVLEDAIAPPPAFTPFTLASALQADLDNRTLSKSLRDAFPPGALSDKDALVTVADKGRSWRIDDLPYSYTIRKQAGQLEVAARGRQTVGSAQERAASPQYINPKAYEKLALQVYPLAHCDTLAQAISPASLPFNLWMEEIRAYLAHLGVRRHELMEAVRPGTRATLLANTHIAREYLGLTTEEAAIITGTTTSQPGADDPGVWNLWGFAKSTLNATVAIPDPASSTSWITSGSWLTVLSQGLDVFLQQAGLQYLELLALLDCYAVNPRVTGERKLSVTAREVSGADTCDPAKLRIVGFDEATAWTVARFLRLWRKLGWPMRDLDRALRALGSSQPGPGRITPAAIDDAFVTSLSHVERLRGTLRLPAETLLAWWSLGLSDDDHLREWWTATYIDHAAVGQPTVPSLYARLFRNKAVTNPIDAAFAEDASFPSGARAQRLDAHAAAIAAALRVSAADLALLMDSRKVLPASAANPSRPDDRLTLRNLAELHRHTGLARALKLTIREYLSVLELTDVQPFATPCDTVRFTERVGALRASGFTVTELDYLLRHEYTTASGVAPATQTIALALAEIRTGLQAIAAENTFITDPADPRGPTVDKDGELTRKKLALLGWDTSLVDRAIDLLNDRAVWEVKLTADPGDLEALNDSGAYEVHLAALPAGYQLPKALEGVVYFDFASKKLKARRELTDKEGQILLAGQAAMAAPAAIARAVAELLAQPDKLRGRIEYDPSSQRLRFTGVMTKVRRAHLLDTGIDAAAVNALFEAPRTFAKRNMVTFSVPDYRTDLKALPASVTFPDALGGRAYHDPEAGTLHFVGAMTEAQRTLLEGLAKNPTGGPNEAAVCDAYKAAVGTLFAAPQTARPKRGDEFLTEADRTAMFDDLASPQARFAIVLGKLLPYLRRVLSERLVRQKLAEGLKLEPEAANELLMERLASADESTPSARAIDDFLDARFVASSAKVPPAAGTHPYPFASYLRLHKLALVLSRCEIRATELPWVLDYGKAGSWFDLATLPAEATPLTADGFEAWERLMDLRRLRDALPAGDTLLTKIFKMLSSATGTQEAVLSAVCEETEWDAAEAKDLAGASGFGLARPADYKDGQALARLKAAFDVLDRLGISAKQAQTVATAHLLRTDVPAEAQQLRDAAHTASQAARAKYDEQQWLEVARPLRDVLREKQRAALVSYLVAHPFRQQQKHPSAPAWRDVGDLFAYFLIDVEMTPVQLTSRIKQAIGSVQLFAQRCLLDLEPEARTGVQVDSRWREWEWMKNYRIWEANRKVFLYPENWIEPELRDDKSPFFKELENELQQTDLTESDDETDVQAKPIDPVETAFQHYLEKLDEVAQLEIVGMFHQQEKAALTGLETTDLLHVLGRTRSTPHVYYYRRRVDGAYWTAWEKVNLDIEGDHLLPVVWNRRLYLFWPVFTEKQDEQKITLPTEKEPLEAKKRYWQIQIAWSEYQGGKWRAKRITSQSLNPRSLNYLDCYDEQLSDLGKSQHVFRARTVGDDLCIWYEKRGGTPSGAPAPDGEYLTVGAFYFRVSTGLVEINTTAKFGVPELEGTDAEGQLLREVLPTFLPDATGQLQPAEVGGPLYLPNTKAGAAADVALATTPAPGVGAFSIAYAHQDRKVTGARPFFFQDDAHTFFVSPESQPVSPPGRVEWHLATPGVFYVAEQMWDLFEKVKPEPGPHPPVQQLENAWMRSRDPFLLEPSAPEPEVALTGVGTLASARRATASAVPAGVSSWLGRTQPMLRSHIEAILTPDQTALAGWLNERYYRFWMFHHPYSTQFVRYLNRDGIPGVLQRPLQRVSYRFFDTYGPSSSLVPAGQPTVDDPAPNHPHNEVDFSYGGAYSLYNWELFFHAPLLIAGRLSRNQQFAAAHRWFHYIFDPTDRSGETAPQRFWKTKPFFETTSKEYSQQAVPAMLRLLATRGDATALAGLTANQRTDLEELEAKVREWRKKPFRPHAIACQRTTAYQKTVVMKYLDNLIAWGDQLFRRDTIESINEATQLYVYAAEILGPRPQRFPPRALPVVQTFRTLEPKLDVFSDALVGIEDFVPPSRAPARTNGGTRTPISLPMLYFCVPNNDQLLGYWNTVADRLYKVRHGLSIEGVARQLPLFEPPIEPALLVKAAAAGIDISSALNDISATLPHYRFATMAQKAGDLCSEVKALGTALLAALEKRDAETLALLRSTHEIALLDAVREVKTRQVEEATTSLEGLRRAQELAELRKQHYSTRAFMNASEQAHLRITESAQSLQTSAAEMEYLANVLGLIPDTKAGVPTTCGVTFGGSLLSGAMKAMSGYMSSTVSHLHTVASLSATMGGYQRRWEDWDLQRRLAEKESDQIGKQILAAEVRLAIAQHELKNHDRQIENAEAVDDFMRDKFTSEELYDWMVGQIAGIYFQAYQLAYDVAKRAERAYRHELGLEDCGFIKFGYWDSLKKGLLAGERLAHDLKRMEADYLDRHAREYEITKHVSLASLDPVALLRLRQTGECFVSIPEAAYDLDYPGHYMRRIKSVGVTIPCVTGPYAGVSCTLTLLGHSARKSADVAGGSYARADEDPRFTDAAGAVQSIVTSGAQNDSGLFEPTLRDERYLPFEGAGAISSWHLRLPATFRPFDYDTISDVVLHIRYTAREGGQALRQAAEAELTTALKEMLLAQGRQGLARMFSARHDFPDQWHAFLHPQDTAAKQTLSIPIAPRLFPYVFHGRTITVTQVDLLLSLSSERAPGKDKSPVDAYPGKKALSLTLTPPASTPENKELKSDQTLCGMPHASFPDLTVDVAEGAATWTIDASPANIATIADELRENKGIYTRLNSTAFEDLIVVLRFTVA
ncbi:MAG: neuraminidase-like domain-containing protein [Micromonosporaceae bacterium]